MSLLHFLTNANGIAQLWAADGQFLGLLSSNQYDQNSIINPNTYGSFYSYTSIKNPTSPYGGACGTYSPYNITSINPPVIVYQGQLVIVATKNAYIQTNSLPIIDPDLMLSVYAQQTIDQHPALIHQQATADLTSTLLQANADRSASNAELISNAIQAGMSGVGRL